MLRFFGDLERCKSMEGDPFRSMCEGDNICENGICQAAPRLNQPCSETTGGYALADDAECLNGVCTKLVWVSAGGDCDASKGSICRGGLQCNPVGGPGKCEVSPPSPQQLAADCQ